MSDGDPTHWQRWHAPYENPDSPLSQRLRVVQDRSRDAIDRAHWPKGGEALRVISICAGQGRDIIDVLAQDPRAGDIEALLVELDPGLVAFARDRAADAGLQRVTVVEGDASQSAHYADAAPADLILVCGLFGNISEADIDRTVHALPGLCREGAQVIWTRHRRAPDLTPAIRGWFEGAGFTEMGFEAPAGFILATGRHRFDGAADAADSFDPDHRLFDFVGDGHLPA